MARVSLPMAPRGAQRLTGYKTVDLPHRTDHVALPCKTPSVRARVISAVRTSRPPSLSVLSCNSLLSNSGPRRVRFAGVSPITFKAQANRREPKLDNVLANKISSRPASSVKRPRTGRTYKPHVGRLPLHAARTATFRRPRPRCPQTSYTVLDGYKRARMQSPARRSQQRDRTKCSTGMPLDPGANRNW